MFKFLKNKNKKVIDVDRDICPTEAIFVEELLTRKRRKEYNMKNIQQQQQQQTFVEGS